MHRSKWCDTQDTTHKKISSLSKTFRLRQHVTQSHQVIIQRQQLYLQKFFRWCDLCCRRPNAAQQAQYRARGSSRAGKHFPSWWQSTVRTDRKAQYQPAVANDTRETRAGKSIKKTIWQRSECGPAGADCREWAPGVLINCVRPGVWWAEQRRVGEIRVWQVSFFFSLQSLL